MTKYSTATATGFADYHEARGRTVPGIWDTDFIDAKLLVASEYIDDTYGAAFVGYKTGGFDQEREWPRTGAVSNSFPSRPFGTSEIPERLTNAVYEAAWREASASGSLNADFKPNKYSSVDIDGAVAVEYAANITSAADIQVQIPVIDSLLAPLLNPWGAESLSSLSGSTSRV